MSGGSARFCIGGCDRVLSAFAMTVFMSVSFFLMLDVGGYNFISFSGIKKIYASWVGPLPCCHPERLCYPEPLCHPE
jgi:hypothetical protein